MTSAIDITKPASGTPTTASVRANFASARAEIEALQAAQQALQAATQPLDATLTALAALLTSADKLIYATGADQFAITTLTAYARGVLAASTASAMRDALGAGSLGGGLFTSADAATARALLSLGSVALLNAVAYGNIQNVSATDRVLGRSSGGAGTIEEIACTAAGRALIDDADATAQRATLGLGSIAVQDAASVSLTGGTINGPAISRAGLSLGGWHASRFHGGQMTVPSSAQSLAIAANTLYVLPFAVGDTATFVRIGIDVVTADAGKSVRLGIYGWNNGLPGARVLDAGVVSVASTGVKEIVISQALPAGMHALALVCDGAPVLRANDLTPTAAFAIGTATPGTADYRMSRGFTYGALPDPWGTPSYGAGSVMLPSIYLRTGT